LEASALVRAVRGSRAPRKLFTGSCNAGTGMRALVALVIGAALVAAVLGIVAYRLMVPELPHLDGARVLVLVADRYNHQEYSYVVDALRRQGAHVVVASFSLETVHSYDGGSVKPDITFEQVELGGYHAIYIPGGYAPEKLAESELVLNLVREARRRGLVVAAICHGPLVLARAGVIDGVKVTGYSAVLDELRKAGGIVVAESAVRDGDIITGTDPSALPQFTKLFAEALAEKLGGR